jgi:hypothetical protein
MPVPANSKAEQMKRQQEALTPAWHRWLATLDQVQRDVLEKYGLVRDGKPVIVAYKTPTPSRSDFSFTNARDEERYADSKISLRAAQRLMALDPTPNHIWTDWIFFEAGGGEEARKRAPAIAAALERGLMDGYLKKAVKDRGLPSDSRRWPPGAAEEINREVEAKLEPRRADALRLASNAEEDMIARLTTHAKGSPFGYSYDFPGHVAAVGRYDMVEKTTTAFFSVYRKAVEMNEVISDKYRHLDPGEDAVEPVPLTPDDIRDVGVMQDVVRRVKHFWQARSARSDVRVGRWKEKTTVYDDDNVTLIVPLTYAAAVRYGVDAWPWANKDTFMSDVKQARSTAWQRATDGGMVGYMTIHTPLGSFMHGRGTGLRRARYNFVALVVKYDTLRVHLESGQEISYEEFIEALKSFAEQPPAEQPAAPEPAAPDAAQAQPQGGVQQRGIAHPLVPSKRKRPAAQIEATLASIQSAVEEFHEFSKKVGKDQIVRDVSAIDITQEQGMPQGD